jgi:anti-sigma regulatory factor (Ser/Thr protein kinase)
MAVSNEQTLERPASAAPVPRAQPSHEGRAAGTFRHEAILHGDGAEGFVREVLPLIKSALQEGAPVMVAVQEDRIAALGQALGKDAEKVSFTDIRRLGANPARMIPAWQEYLDRHAGSGRPPLAIAEHVWADRERAELEECARHEALTNLAFGETGGWRLICSYDIDALDADVIETACREHPIVHEAGEAARSERYSEHGEPLEVFGGELERPLADIWEIPFAKDDLAEIRQLVSSWACREAMPFEATEDLVLAVDEIAANSIRHGGGVGMLRLWRNGERLVCEVQDRGLIEDPLIGRVRPGTSPAAGRGLWIANQLCDLVQIRSGPQGTQVRLHKQLG